MVILQRVCWKIKLYKVVGVILIENVSDILFHGDNKFVIIVSGGNFSEKTDSDTVDSTKKSLVQTGRFLTLPPPGETSWSELTWLVRSGISGFPRNSVYPKSCRCSSKRSKRVQGGVLFDCAGFQSSSVLNHDRMVSWKGWTACPLTVLASKTVGGQWMDREVE